MADARVVRAVGHQKTSTLQGCWSTTTSRHIFNQILRSWQVDNSLHVCVVVVVLTPPNTPNNMPQDGAPRFCNKCGHYKPPRSHHCRVCKRCVLRMDHHCEWLQLG